MISTSISVVTGRSAIRDATSRADSSIQVRKFARSRTRRVRKTRSDHGSGLSRSPLTITLYLSKHFEGRRCCIIPTGSDSITLIKRMKTSVLADKTDYG